MCLLRLSRQATTEEAKMKCPAKISRSVRHDIIKSVVFSINVFIEIIASSDSIINTTYSIEYKGKVMKTPLYRTISLSH